MDIGEKNETLVLPALALRGDVYKRQLLYFIC